MSAQGYAPGWGTGGAQAGWLADTDSSATGPYAEAAADLAIAGWEVLPLNGKIPHTKHGVDDATSDLDIVAAWWQRWPTANIGARVPHDLVVIDVDPRNGGTQTLLNLAGLLGPLPVTLIALTGRGDGGHHRYYLRPAGKLKGRAGAGIDVKTNGYMVMPPSIHPDTGRPYEWIDRDPVALPPTWVNYLRIPAPRQQPRPVPAPGGDGSTLVQWVAQLQEGNRNNGLFWAACRAAEDGQLPDLENDLIGAAVRAGLNQREATATVKSAGKRGA